MEGHAKKCVERYCELANRTTQELYKVSTPCIDDHHFKDEEMKSVGELSQVCSLNCCKMFILGTYWKTWHSMVNEQTCMIHFKNGPKPVTNDYVVWYLTSITHVNTNCIVTWVILQNNADWDCFKTLLREILRTQYLFLVEHCAFFGSHTFVPISLMCKKKNFSFAQFNRIRNHFFGCRIEVGWYSRTWFVGSDRRSSWEHESESSRTGRPGNEQTWSSFTTSHNAKNASNLREWSMIWIMLILFPQTSNLLIWKLCMCLKTTKQWQRWLSKKEVPQWDMFPGPTELLLLVIRSNQFGPQNPNQIHWHQKPIGRHTDQGKFYTWWMESSSVFVQHQPIQFYQLFWRKVEKNAKKMQVKKESQQSRNRWWIWSRNAAKRLLTCLPLLHQKIPVKTRYESQIPLSSWTEQHLRTVRLVKDACSSSYSERNADEKWSSQSVEIWRCDGS